MPLFDMNAFPQKFFTSGFSLLLRSFLILISLTILVPFFHSPVSAETFYSIRLASYRDKIRAVKEVNELKKLGHHAFMKTVNLKGKGTWHRVYIERYPTRAEALKEARVFKELELISEYGIDPIYEKEETSAGRVATPRVFFLHVFSFQNLENAEKTVDRLRTEGHKAFYVKEKINGKDWFRVYVGEFSSEQSARQAGLELKKKGLISYFKPIKIDRKLFKQEIEKPR